MARDLNKWTGVGRVGSDVELKQTKNGVDAVDFSIANNRDYADTKRVNWIRCRAYKGLAKMMSQYVKKGMRVGISGEITVDKWQDDKKEWHERTYVLVDEFEFLDGGKSDDADSKSKGNSGEQSYRYEEYEEYDPSVEF